MGTPTISAASEERTTFGWVDGVVLLAIFGLLWSVLHFGRGKLVHFDESQMPQLSTNLSDIPYYAGRTVLRMWIAFAFSLLFTLIVGYGAHLTTACCPNGCRCELRNRKGQQQPCLL